MVRLAAVLIVAMFVISACTPGAAPPGGPQGAADTPVRGGRIVQAATADITQLNPILTAAGVDESVWSHFYLPLLGFNGDTGELEPGLAEKFGMSADGLTVTYTLRSGLVWSDGVAFTGEDFRYNVEALARSQRGIRKGNFSDVVGWKDYIDGKTDSISGITVSQDGLTITVKLARAVCFALERLQFAGGGIIPKHHFEKGAQGWQNKTTDPSKTIDEHPLNNAPPASMGPFVFKERRAGVEIVMVANDKYYRGRPNIDEYLVKVYSDTAAVKNALLTGEVSFANVAAADVEEIRRTNPGLTMYREKNGQTYNWILWNQKSTKAPWLASKEVRQALWHGLNIKQITESVLRGYATPVYAHLAPVSWAHDDTGLKRYDYDQARAKQLLEGAGARMGPDGVYRWKDGQPMEMRIETVAGNRQAEQILQIVQEQYKGIGIKIDPLFETTAQYFARNDPTALDREGTTGAWTRGPDPDSWHFFHSAAATRGLFNWANYINPEVDRLIIQGRHGPDCSQATRKRAYSAVDRQLNDDAVYTFLYAPDTLMFANKAIQNFDVGAYAIPGLRGWAQGVEKWWIKK